MMRYTNWQSLPLPFTFDWMVDWLIVLGRLAVHAQRLLVQDRQRRHPGRNLSLVLLLLLLLLVLLVKVLGMTGRRLAPSQPVCPVFPSRREWSRQAITSLADTSTSPGCLSVSVSLRLPVCRLLNLRVHWMSSVYIHWHSYTHEHQHNRSFAVSHLDAVYIRVKLLEQQRIILIRVWRVESHFTVKRLIPGYTVKFCITVGPRYHRFVVAFHIGNAYSALAFCKAVNIYLLTRFCNCVCVCVCVCVRTLSYCRSHCCKDCGPP